ncbi:MAG: FtsQ-type POTRA domain-containing protein [Candidatus Omnitrophica bacterium]|nr:FtsQ-type POTRA domain-containing protein [Candidatus Omnitrophota bacterium]
MARRRSRRKRRRQRRKLKIKIDLRGIFNKLKEQWAAFVVLALLAGVAWFGYGFLTESSYFRIEKVVVTPASALDAIPIENIEKRIKGYNMFDLDLRSLRDSILRGYPEVLKVSVYKRLPNKIQLNLKVREAVAQISSSRYYPIDREGVVLSDVRNFPYERLPVIAGVAVRGDQVGKVLESERLHVAFRLMNDIRESGLSEDYRVSIIDVNDQRNTSFMLEGGVKINMGRGDFKKDLDRLKDILRQPGMKLEDIRYIDMRFKNAVIGPR